MQKKGESRESVPKTKEGQGSSRKNADSKEECRADREEQDAVSLQSGGRKPNGETFMGKITEILRIQMKGAKKWTGNDVARLQ